METDLLIVGAGPAGLQAALTASTYGVKTTLIDQGYELGGQLKQQTQFIEKLPTTFKKQRGTSLLEALRQHISASNVDVLLRHTMIGAYKDGSIGVSNGRSTFPIRAKKVIMATGAAEEPSVFPGWTKPGVMTVGAAQILMNLEFVLPGKNAMILGSNDFSLEVAKQLKACGVNVLGIIESGGQLLSRNDELIQSIKDEHIHLFLNSFISQATGTEELEKVIIHHNGVEEEFEVDLVCIGNGLSPILEPFEIMECQFTYEEHLGGWLPAYDENLETSTPSLYVAGNAAGITCMGAILLTGEIAAVSALQSLGAISDEEAKQKREALWQELLQIEAHQVSAARVSLMKKFQKGTAHFFLGDS